MCLCCTVCERNSRLYVYTVQKLHVRVFVCRCVGLSEFIYRLVCLGEADLCLSCFCRQLKCGVRRLRVAQELLCEFPVAECFSRETTIAPIWCGCGGGGAGVVFVPKRTRTVYISMCLRLKRLCIDCSGVDFSLCISKIMFLFHLENRTPTYDCAQKVLMGAIKIN